MRIYSKTDVGAVRKNNQDAFAAGEFKNGMAWCVVCDGMGGANGGEIAGKTAVKSITDFIFSSYHSGMSENSIRNMLISAVETANISVYDIAQKQPELKGMGTTVVAVVIDNEKVHIVHAGDSRMYIVRSGAAMQITRDHSIVQNMVESGKLTAEEAKKHPDKNVITRALGIFENIDTDYDCLSLIDGDIVLVCTDGLTNYVDIPTIETILADGQLSTAPDRLVEAAIEKGGGDNITVVLLS